LNAARVVMWRSLSVYESRHAAFISSPRWTRPEGRSTADGYTVTAWRRFANVCGKNHARHLVLRLDFGGVRINPGFRRCARSIRCTPDRGSR
jgi:hypothetical protein